MRIRVLRKDERIWERPGGPRSDTASSPGDQSGKSAAESETPELTGYLLSLPERVVRSAAAVSAGLLREIGDAGLPEPVRRTKLYSTMVDATLRFLIERVGQVEGAYPAAGSLGDDFAVRRAAGNGIELVGILAFHASPVWVMAALADLSGTGRQLVAEIADSLKQEGLLDPDTNFESVDQMLDGLERTSGRLADAINTPPLDVAGLRREWREVREEARRIPPQRLPSAERLRGDWNELRAVAKAQDRSVFQVSALLALSAAERLPENLLRLSRGASVAVKRAGGMFAEPVLNHYAATLAEIREAGFLTYWSQQFRPYLHGAAKQFSRRQPSLTERILNRAAGGDGAKRS